jgi:hypothetical protein
MDVPWSGSGFIRFLCAAALGMISYLLFIVLFRLVDAYDVQRMKRWSRKLWRRT